MSHSLTIIIVDKNKSLKTLRVKDYNVDNLYKKCGFKQSTNFNLQVEWSVIIDGKKYIIQMYGKQDGKSNIKNKYEFPPPIDKKIYFGACALVGMISDNLNTKNINLSIDLWNKCYNKLFGGDEDLNIVCDDDLDDDNLDNVTTSKKSTVQYLKDGNNIVDSDTEYVEPQDFESEDEDDTECSNGPTEESCANETYLNDVGSELSEESYDL